MNILDTIKNAFGQGSDDDDFFDSQWEYGQERDAMRDAETMWARLRSDNSVYLRDDTVGEAYVDLIIRKMSNNRFILAFQLSRNVFASQSGGFFANIKFDRGKIEKQYCKTSSYVATNMAFIIQGIDKFIRKLIKSKTLIAEFVIEGHGSEQFIFQTAGLDWQGIFGNIPWNIAPFNSNFLQEQEKDHATTEEKIENHVKNIESIIKGIIAIGILIWIFDPFSIYSNIKKAIFDTPSAALATPKATPPVQPVAQQPEVAEVAASAPQAAPQPAIPPAPVGKRRWEPQDACQYLSHTLPTRRYNDAVGDGIYICASEYQDIGTRTSDRMANNLSYYVIGTQNHARKLKLLLNYNNPKQAASGTTALITAAKELAIAATGKSLPKTIESKLKTGKAGETTIDGIRHAVYRQNWPRGNGYEVRYVLSNANDKPIIRNELTGANTDISDYPDADKDIIPTADTAAEKKADEKKEAATPVNSKWRYNEDTDQMRNTKSYWAMLTSENSVDFDFPYNGGSTLRMELRKSAKYGNDIYFTISKGQFSCGYDGCHAIIKFDDSKPQKISLVGAADGDMTTLFLSGKASNLAAKIKKSKTMMIELHFFQEGSRQFLFQTEGLQWKHF